MRLEFWFDFSCPYAYIAATQIQEVARRTGADLHWRPMLLGGVFRGIGLASSPMDSLSPAKARYNALDMQRWAQVYEVPLTIPAGHPIRTVRALRALLSLPEERWPPVIAAFYRAYWVRGQDISRAEVVAQVLGEAGIDGDDRSRALAANDDPAIKDELRRRTDEAVARGVFGAPSMFIGEGESAPMFWGQDRLEMVEAALRGWRPGTPPDRSEPAARMPEQPLTVQFWYDFSSPFAYLGSTQIEAIARRTGARLTWRPMLLGAVFKEIGQHNVPLASFSDNKRRYMGRELTEYWPSWWQVPLQFASRFPQRTITALRLALQAGDRIAELSHALFRVMWVDDGNLEDEATLRAVLDEHRFDADAMLAGTADPAVKQALIANTTEAVTRGAFGAPSCIIERPDGDLLFWGQDRLDLVERVLGGWHPRH